ncbi:MAG: hypothetical protein AAGE76_01120 [Pseudomonadota bacterium]
MSEGPIAGFVTPPGWYDPSPSEFVSLCAAPVRTQQSMLDVPDLDFDDLAAISATEPGVARSAHLLGLAGADVAACIGTPFTWAGLSTEAEMRARIRTIEAAAGCPFIMPGTAIVDGLRALAARRIGVYAPYYIEPWQAAMRLAFEACGFDVAVVTSADTLGLVSARTTIADHEQASSPDIAREGLRRITQTTSGLEALVIAGAGVRTVDLTPEAEAELDMPVVSSDTATHWAMARSLSVPLRPGVIGRLGVAS